MYFVTGMSERFRGFNKPVMPIKQRASVPFHTEISCSIGGDSRGE